MKKEEIAGIMRMIDYYLREEVLFKAEEGIDLLPEGSKIKNNYLEIILSYNLDKYQLDKAQEMANKIKRKLTVDEIENSLMRRIKNGGIGKPKLKVDEARNITKKYLKRDLKVDELEALLETHQDKVEE